MTTRTLSLARSLTLAAFALEYMSSRSRDAGDLTHDQVSEAWDCLSELIKSTHAGPKRNALLTARLALRCLCCHLLGYRRTRTIPVSRLREARPIVGRMLEQAEREEDAYWQDFTAGAMDEVEAILDSAE